MTTTVTPSLGLMARVREAEAMWAQELPAFGRARDRLVQFAADVLGETVDPSSVRCLDAERMHDDQAAVEIDGVTFTQRGWLPSHWGPSEAPPALVSLPCERCQMLGVFEIRTINDLANAVRETDAHQRRCQGPPKPFVDPVVAAWDAYGRAKAQEMLLEDERPLIKAAAVLRLIESKQATSATAAEKVVELDSEYMAHRVRQRDAVIATQRALGMAKAADYRARESAQGRSR